MLEAFAERSGTQVAVTALVRDQMVVLAMAGVTAEDRVSETFIGQKIRAFPPLGATFMAWEPAERVAAWTGLAPADQGEALLARLESVRRHGMAFSLEGGTLRDWRGAMSEAAAADEQTRQQVLASRAWQTVRIDIDESDAPHVRNLHIPVFASDGRACLFLNVGGFPPLDMKALTTLEGEIKDVAGRISELAAGRTDE
jgi:DNA-binding IclR family transcriptional regulator